MKAGSAVLGVLCAISCGCATAPSTPTPPPHPGEPRGAHSSESATFTPSRRPVQRRITVPIVAKSGSALLGQADLSESERGVSIVVRIGRVEPGLHGVHIHEVADCSAPDATSAGDHFNPEGHPHALPSSRRQHLGDLGNILVRQLDRTGRLEITVAGATLEPRAPLSFLNRSLVVHAEADRGTQPAGNAGARIGCAELRADDALLRSRYFGSPGPTVSSIFWPSSRAI